jgi:hypothetical protein
MALTQKLDSGRHHLQSINRYRIWLQITWIAEITDTKRETIIYRAITGEEDDHKTPALWQITYFKLSLPTPQLPPAKAWNISKHTYNTSERTKQTN